MDYFNYKKGQLYCEGVSVADIAEKLGTPLYVYSAATLLRHYSGIAEAFAELRPTVCYSIKSLANVHVLRLLAGAGCSFDVTSGGELARAKAAGADCSKIVFAGVGKTDREITEAIAAGIGLFNIESEQEFQNISRLAENAGATVRAALRVNPNVYDRKTHGRTATGKKATKFGVDIDRAEAFFRAYGRSERVRLCGVHVHIGSPIYSAGPYVQALRKVLPPIDRLRAAGHEITVLDIGGGFAADYSEGASPLAADYAGQIVPLLRGRGLEVIIEPGRQISCNSGILVARVQYTKEGGGKRFLVADAGMNDLIRPVLYDAEHFIYPVRLRRGDKPPRRRVDFRAIGGRKVDVVGSVCETDWLGKDRVLPPVNRGELLAVFSAGAYGFVMSSQYNSRPRAAEALVEGERWRIIRRRETYDDLMAAELDV